MKLGLSLGVLISSAAARGPVTDASECWANEELHTCGLRCEPACHDRFPVCTTTCGPPGCFCEDGYYRDASGNCVTKDTCTTSCRLNSNWSICPSLCEATCDDPNPTCSSGCGNAKCACDYGLVRDKSTGNCIAASACPASCPASSTWTTCSSLCEPSCDNSNPICGSACGDPKCQCDDGFYRDTSTGTCVAGAGCPAKTTAPTVTVAPGLKNCPECWEWNETEKKCTVKRGDGACYDLKCEYNAMHLSFNTKLFAVEYSTDSAFPFVQTDKNVVWDSTSSQWKSTCNLGECGMKCNTRDVGESGIHLVFGYELSVETHYKNINGHLVYMKNPIKAKVTFECAYRSEVKISSTEFEVKSVDAAGESIEFGNLDEGFTIKLYTDPSYTNEITTTTTTLFIGQPVYTTVEWNVKTLTNHAKYYVDGCSIELPKDSTSGADRAMQLIKSNCYSSTLQVQQLQADKLVSTASKFKFTSFIVDKGASTMKFEMKCNVKVCSISETGGVDKCNKYINTQDATCPNASEDVVMKYRANTYA